LVELLLNDAALRSEVRNQLGAATLDQIELDGNTTADMHEQLARSDDPEDVLAAAGTHPDSTIAAAIAPYLLGELELPPRHQPSSAAIDPQGSVDAPRKTEGVQELRQELRKARSGERELAAQIKSAQTEAEQLRTSLDTARQDLASSKAKVAELQNLVPTRRQRKALEAATDVDSELRRTKDALELARAGRDKELQNTRQDLAEAIRELDRVNGELEAERRGRRRLEQELGDATGRARRLLPLTERDARSLVRDADTLREGPERTRLQKRAQALQQLASSLRELYDLHEPSEAADTSGDTRARRSKTSTVTTERGIRVTPLGGNNHIGGSALLLEAAGTRVLIDAGIRPQAHVSRPGPLRINEAVGIDLNAIIITHAHADHAGYVPWVVEKQRRAKVLCSPQTKSLLPTVWGDSVRVMRAEADASSRGGNAVEPPYGEGEVAQAEEALVGLPYGQTKQVKDLEITLFPAGHVLGAAGVVIRAGDRRIVITGDIDDRGQASVGPAQIPAKLADKPDLLVIETTYCDRNHSDREQEGSNLIIEAEAVLATGGRILIPAFGLGRAQEIALLLGERMPNVEVLVDGIARDISELYALNGAPEVLRGRVRKVTDRDRQIRGFDNGIVITTSGMLTGGAAVPWAQAVLSEPSSALFLCGHQDEEAPGKQLELLAGAEADSPRDIQLRDSHGRPLTIPVAAKVHRYNLSAHADRRGLMSIVDQIRPKAVMLVHGEPRPQRTFAALLRGKGYVVVDNEAQWDSEAPTVDSRRGGWRHAATSTNLRASRQT
jgi:Cft2 family RNA processing exonuclease